MPDKDLPSDLVHLWMRHFGLSLSDPDFDPYGINWDLIREEYNELHDAIFNDESRSNEIKEMGDLIWVCKYRMWQMGVDPNEVERRIFNSNMSKLVNGKPVFREDGKVLKGPNYVPPNMDDL